MVDLDQNKHIILIINQGLLDNSPLQTEALLKPHQAREHSVLIDDLLRWHRCMDGTTRDKAIQIEDYRITLEYNRWKVFMRVMKTNSNDWSVWPQVKETSPLPYNPGWRIFTRRFQKHLVTSLGEFHKCLGYLSMETTRKTIQGSTQMVRTVEAEDREYMCDHFKERLLPLHPHRVDDVCFPDTFISDKCPLFQLQQSSTWM